MDWTPYIEQRANLLGGKPVCQGTRVPAALVVEHLAAGWTEQALLENYPTLRIEHIRAALAFAAEAVNESEWNLESGVAA